MSRVIRVYLDDATERRIEEASKETGRSVEELAEAAVSEAAVNYWRSRGDLTCPTA